MLFWFSVVQGLGYLHERTYIEAQMQRILEPWRKGRKDEECGNGNCGRLHQGTRKIVAGRSICRAGSIRVESRRTFRRFREAPGKRNSMAVRKIEIIAFGKIVIILNHKGLRKKSTLIK